MDSVRKTTKESNYCSAVLKKDINDISPNLEATMKGLASPPITVMQKLHLRVATSDTFDLNTSEVTNIIEKYRKKITIKIEALWNKYCKLLRLSPYHVSKMFEHKHHGYYNKIIDS